MSHQIKDEASKIASYIWSLPGHIRYPILLLIASLVPAIIITIGSVTLAISPLIIATIIFWYLANRAG